jgi:hypothetical protein
MSSHHGLAYAPFAFNRTSRVLESTGTHKSKLNININHSPYVVISCRTRARCLFSIACCCFCRFVYLLELLHFGFSAAYCASSSTVAMPR